MDRFKIVPLQVRKTPVQGQPLEHWGILSKRDTCSTKSCSLDPYHSHVSTAMNAPSQSWGCSLSHTTTMCHSAMGSSLRASTWHSAATSNTDWDLSSWKQCTLPLSNGLMLWRWIVSALHMCQHRQSSTQLSTCSLPGAAQTDVQQLLWAQWDCCTCLRHRGN